MTAAASRLLERVFARRLREVAEQQGLALSHLADRAGLARSHLWQIVRARANPTFQVVERLADALEVDPRSLLQGEPDRQRATRPRKR